MTSLLADRNPFNLTLVHTFMCVTLALVSSCISDLFGEILLSLLLLLFPLLSNLISCFKLIFSSLSQLGIVKGLERIFPTTPSALESPSHGNCHV